MTNSNGTRAIQHDLLAIETLAMYHGTSQCFEVFNRESLGQNTGHYNTQLGFFFTPDKVIAAEFAKQISGGDRVIEVSLTLNNPVDLTLQGVFTKKGQAVSLWEIISDERVDPDEALELLNDEVGLGDILDFYEAVASKEGREILIRDGYDGVVSDMGSGHLEYVAFDPEQIRIVAEHSAQDILDNNPGAPARPSLRTTNA